GCQRARSLPDERIRPSRLRAAYRCGSDRIDRYPEPSSTAPALRHGCSCDLLHDSLVVSIRIGEEFVRFEGHVAGRVLVAIVLDCVSDAVVLVAVDPPERDDVAGIEIDHRFL